jgi:hypothetical protein
VRLLKLSPRRPPSRLSRLEMATRSRPTKPPCPPITRPRRRRECAAQPIPRAADVFDWRPNEVIVGAPRPARKAREPGDA